jgi:hypothetical protein
MSSIAEIGRPLTQEEAEAIYRQGQEAVIFALLKQSKVIFELASKVAEKDRLIEELADSEDRLKNKDLSTPSGAIPVYKKENSSDRGRKKPGQKPGHKGEYRRTPLEADETEVLPPPALCPRCGGPVRDRKIDSG